MPGFIRHDASKSDAGGIVNGDVDKLPARLADFIAAVASDAMAWVFDAGELFDIEMDKFTGNWRW